MDMVQLKIKRNGGWRKLLIYARIIAKCAGSLVREPSCWHSLLRTWCVMEDNEAIGSLGAQHLLLEVLKLAKPKKN